MDMTIKKIRTVKVNKTPIIPTSTTTVAPVEKSDKTSPTLSEAEMKLFNEFVQKIKIKGEKTESERLQPLHNTLMEYTSCYLTLAFDLEGNPIIQSYIKTQKDLNALNDLLRKVFMNMVNNE